MKVTWEGGGLFVPCGKIEQAKCEFEHDELIWCLFQRRYDYEKIRRTQNTRSELLWSGKSLLQVVKKVGFRNFVCFNKVSVWENIYIVASNNSLKAMGEHIFKPKSSIDLTILFKTGLGGRVYRLCMWKPSARGRNVAPWWSRCTAYAMCCTQYSTPKPKPNPQRHYIKLRSWLAKQVQMANKPMKVFIITSH